MKFEEKQFDIFVWIKFWKWWNQLDTKNVFSSEKLKIPMVQSSFSINWKEFSDTSGFKKKFNITQIFLGIIRMCRFDIKLLLGNFYHRKLLVRYNFRFLFLNDSPNEQYHSARNKQNHFLLNKQYHSGNHYCWNHNQNNLDGIINICVRYYVPSGCKFVE